MASSRTTFDDVTIPGDGFDLRALTDRDVELIFEACQDPLTNTWLPLPQPYTREFATGFVNTSLGCRSDLSGRSGTRLPSFRVPK